MADIAKRRKYITKKEDSMTTIGIWDGPKDLCKLASENEINE